MDSKYDIRTCILTILQDNFIFQILSLIDAKCLIYTDKLKTKRTLFNAIATATSIHNWLLQGHLLKISARRKYHQRENKALGKFWTSFHYGSFQGLDQLCDYSMQAETSTEEWFTRCYICEAVVLLTRQWTMNLICSFGIA